MLGTAAMRWIFLLCLLTPLSAAGAQEFELLPVPYVPTQMEAVDRMLSLAGVGPGDVVYDLGSGDGRIVIVAAARYGARGVGFEIDPELVARSRATARQVGVADRVRFVSDDLFEADLSPASVVTLYLSPDFNLRLRPRLLDLRPGTRVVSHDFHMGEWRADSVVHVRRGFAQTSVYLWIVPARVDGFWYVEMDGGASFSLELRQEFQRISGAVLSGGASRPLQRARLRGDQIEFEVRDHSGGAARTVRFSGTVTEKGIRGTATAPPPFGTRAWSAVRFTSPGMAPPRGAPDASGLAGAGGAL